jgi:glycine/D-amino acid oxidase-like deaminating enzyme
MNDDPRSHGLWEASAPPAPATRPLTSDIDVDVAIVGGGFTGLSAALHLQRQGASTVVVEAAELGFGGSGRNVGLVNAGMWTMPSALAGELGDVHGPRLLKLLGAGPDLVYGLVQRYGMDCEAVRRGTLHCAVGSAGLRNIGQRAREWQAAGVPVSLLDAEETARRTGTRRYRGALLDLRAGTIQPLAYVRGLARAVIAEGARVCTRTRVERVEDLGSHWRLRTDAGGAVQAKWIVIATNAFTELSGPWPALRAELVHLPYFNMATAPLPDHLRSTILPGGEGAWDTPDVLTSFRLDRQGRLVLGSVGALRGAGSAIHRGWGRRALAKLFPPLAGIGFEYEWFGWIGMTSDALPRFHRLARNVVSFSGYNGRGIATGTTFGRELSRLVTGETTEAELTLPVTSPEAVALRSVRESYYEVGAQIAHLSGARMLMR